MSTVPGAVKEAAMAWNYSEKTQQLFMDAVQGKPGTHLGEIENADGLGEHGYQDRHDDVSDARWRCATRQARGVDGKKVSSVRLTR